MFFYEDLICPICDKIFMPDDDVVSCPDCGAPHHRECWKKIGSCSLSEFHGTADQWSKEKALEQRAFQNDDSNNDTKICPNCSTENYEYAEFCFKCGRDLVHNDWNSVPFHRAYTVADSQPQHNNENQFYDGDISGDDHSSCPGSSGTYSEYAPFSSAFFDLLGGVAKDEQIDGISAEEMANYVGSNTAYYLPRFVAIDKEKSNISWNWVAFLFTPYWLLFRKNKVAGFLVLFFELISAMFTSYIMQIHIVPNIGEVSMSELYSYMLNNASMRNFLLILVIFNVVSLIISIAFGLYGNALYFTKVKLHITHLRAKHYGKNQIVEFIKPEYRSELISEGGVGFTMLGIALGLYYLIQFIFTMIISR